LPIIKIAIIKEGAIKFWNNLVNRIKHLPKRKQLLLAVVAGLVAIGIGVLIWAIVTGKIKPFAAGNQIINTATVTYQDQSGGNHVVNSNTVITDLTPIVNATLTLSPATNNISVGTNFDVAIVLNTNGQATVGADAVLTYNPSELQVQDADSGTSGVQIKPGTLYPNTTLNSVDTTNGKISYSGAITSGTTTRYNGTGTLATITFKPLKIASPSAVNFTFTLGQTNDSNVVIDNGSDILATATGGQYTIVSATATVNLSIALQGRQLPDGSTNYTTSQTSLTAYATGTTTNPVFSKTDITTNATGKSTFTITSLPSGNYDFKIKVNAYLTRTLANQPFTNPLNLNYTDLRAGDLNNDNIVNTIDYAQLNAKWGQSDPTADINQDGIVNSIDFALMNSNWFAQGQ